MTNNPDTTELDLHPPGDFGWKSDAELLDLQTPVDVAPDSHSQEPSPASVKPSYCDWDPPTLDAPPIVYGKEILPSSDADWDPPILVEDGHFMPNSTEDPSAAVIPVFDWNTSIPDGEWQLNSDVEIIIFDPPGAIDNGMIVTAKSTAQDDPQVVYITLTLSGKFVDQVLDPDFKDHGDIYSPVKDHMDLPPPPEPPPPEPPPSPVADTGIICEDPSYAFTTILPHLTARALHLFGTVLCPTLTVFLGILAAIGFGVYFVSITPQFGYYAINFKVLTANTNCAIPWSQICPAAIPTCPTNLCLTDLIDGEPPSRIFHDSTRDSGEINQDSWPSMMVHVDKWECTGISHRAAMDDGNQLAPTSSSHELHKFSWLLLLSNHDQVTSWVMLNGELLAYIIKDEDDQEVPWHYQEPITVSSPPSPSEKRHHPPLMLALNCLI
jgi:hypothetical protein